MNMYQGRPKMNQNDWTCVCGETNFRSRDSCRRCGTGKMFMMKNNQNVKYRPGDWFCACGNLNFASRDACRRCFQLKANIVDPNLVQSGDSMEKDKNMIMKPGDWNCTCGEMNFASRDVCRICALPKPLDVPDNSNQSSPNSPQTPEENNENSNSTENKTNQNEWTCTCGESNFATRNVCRRCNSNKPGTNGTPENNTQPTTETGNNNNDNNMDDTDESNQNNNMGGYKNKSQYRPGDWYCVCGNMNYASREACNRCGMFKNMVLMNPQMQMGFNNNNYMRNHKMKSRDWVCNCGEINFSSRSVCRKCKRSKNLMS